MTSPPCAFTVDVEDYFQVDAFSRVIDPSDWDSFGSRVVANTGRLLDLLDRHQVHGTFLFSAGLPYVIQNSCARSWPAGTSWHPTA